MTLGDLLAATAGRAPDLDAVWGRASVAPADRAADATVVAGDERFPRGRARVGVRGAARSQGRRRRVCPRRDRARGHRRGRRDRRRRRRRRSRGCRWRTRGSRSRRSRRPSSAIRATTSCSSASPAPTARPRPRTCSRRSSRRPASAAGASARSATTSADREVAATTDHAGSARSCSACCARW